jgi:hypothetical protein
MSILVLLWTKAELALRLMHAVPTIDFATAYAHASVAVDVADSTLPAELLLAMAYVESRYDPTATSRIEGSVRRTGSYPSTTPPRNLRGTLYCGPLQSFARTWDDCCAMRDLARGYAAGVDELKRWLRDSRVRGNVTRALLGHGCGNRGLATGQCNGYPNRILYLARRLARPAPPPRSVT